MTETNPSSARNSAIVRTHAEQLAAHFPALLAEAEALARTTSLGEHGRRQAGPGETYWQHRPYSFGDPVSSIDWRQSARASDRLYVRQNEWEAAAAIWFWRDASASMAYSSLSSTPQKHHRATVLSIALAILLSEGGERIGVLSGARQNSPSPSHASPTGSSRLFHGRGAPARVLERFDHDIADDAGALPVGDRIRAGHHLILVSDYLMDPDKVRTAIDHYARRGAKGVLCQVLDPAEIDFPFRGRTEFADVESPERLLFGNAGSLRQSYGQTFQDHQSSLREISNRYGWPYLVHRTDHNAHDALLFLTQAIAQPAAAFARGVKESAA